MDLSAVGASRFDRAQITACETGARLDIVLISIPTTPISAQAGVGVSISSGGAWFGFSPACSAF
jgi:hypothetical protein